MYSGVTRVQEQHTGLLRSGRKPCGECTKFMLICVSGAQRVYRGLEMTRVVSLEPCLPEFLVDEAPS